MSTEQQPPISQDEAQEHIQALRSAPADQVVAELIFTVLNAAQVKLGRNDGRLLIDLAAAMSGQVRGIVTEGLTKQVDEVLTQLRLAQVREEPNTAGKEETDLPSAPPPPDGGQAPEAPRQTSRLWVPGQ